MVKEPCARAWVGGVGKGWEAGVGGLIGGAYCDVAHVGAGAGASDGGASSGIRSASHAAPS